MQTIRESVENTIAKEAKEVGALAQTLDMDAVADVVELLRNLKGKVITSGCGTSGAAAEKIAHTLSCVNCPAFYLNPADAVHGGMGAVSAGDVGILISKGGNTAEILKLIDGCKANGAKLIAITENEDSALARAADYRLIVRVESEPDQWNMLATASTMAVIATMDAVAIALMQRNGFTREKFAVIHPGGAVGERLLNGRQ